MEPLKDAYLRNNRSSGQKSLRCFPHCNDKGHLKSSFCGSHLEATAIIQKDSKFEVDWQNKEVLIIAEIRPSAEQGISGLRSVPRAKILAELRDMRNPRSGGELVLGKIEIMSEDGLTAYVRIIFNGEKHSWDYSWKSNRWSGSSASHVVDVILLESCYSALNNCDLRIYSSLCSMPFILISSHKSTTRSKGSRRNSAKDAGRLVDVSDSTIPKPQTICSEYDDERGDNDPSDGISSAMALVKRTCYIYDIQHETESKKKSATMSPPNFCPSDIIDTIIILPTY